MAAQNAAPTAAIPSSDGSVCYGWSVSPVNLSKYAVQARVGMAMQYTATSCNSYCSTTVIPNVNYSAMVQMGSGVLCFCLIGFETTNPGPSNGCATCVGVAGNCGQGNDFNGAISSVAVLPVISKVVTSAGTSAATSAVPTSNALPLSPTSSAMVPATSTALFIIPDPGTSSTPIGGILGGVAVVLVLAIVGGVWFHLSRSRTLANPIAAQSAHSEPQFLVSAGPLEPPPPKPLLDVSATQHPLVTPEESHTAVDISDPNLPLERDRPGKQALDHSNGLFGNMQALSNLKCDGAYLKAICANRESCRSVLKEDFGIIDPRDRTILADQICGLFEQPSQSFTYENEMPPPFEA
ncbi:hypothetical protein HDU98_000650 [Podochytrium sp. JEL0797]|nr:hypothetical protein HDU98_000650 [Podochytrium sp. JEL0797]